VKLSLDLVGKRVAVIKTDGFVKIGNLIELNVVYLVLQYSDGRQEVITMNQVGVVKEASQ